jgi:hypothetical protein
MTKRLDVMYREIVIDGLIHGARHRLGEDGVMHSTLLRARTAEFLSRSNSNNDELEGYPKQVLCFRV